MQTLSWCVFITTLIAVAVSSVAMEDCPAKHTKNCQIPTAEFEQL